MMTLAHLFFTINETEKMKLDAKRYMQGDTNTEITLAVYEIYTLATKTQDSCFELIGKLLRSQGGFN
jgi:hypothetical protein